MHTFNKRPRFIPSPTPTVHPSLVQIGLLLIAKNVNDTYFYGERF